MKASLLIALLTLGVSFQSYANDHDEDSMDTEHEEMTETVETTGAAKKGEHKKMAMSAKSAEAACKKEGKKGTALTSCIKTKTSAH